MKFEHALQFLNQPYVTLPKNIKHFPFFFFSCFNKAFTSKSLHLHFYLYFSTSPLSHTLKKTYSQLSLSHLWAFFRVVCENGSLGFGNMVLFLGEFVQSQLVLCVCDLTECWRDYHRWWESCHWKNRWWFHLCDSGLVASWEVWLWDL